MRIFADNVKFGVRRLDAAFERRGLTRLCPWGVARQAGPRQSGVKPPHSKRVFSSLLISCLIAASCVCASPDENLPLRESAYTHSCWLNGLRKTKSDTTPTLFAIETSRYGFTLDLGDFRKGGFGPRKDPVPDYAGSLAFGTDWLRELPAAALVFEIELAGKIYRAVNGKAGLGTGNKRFKSVRLWESGRFVQHYDFLDLEFRDAEGVLLPCNACLDLVAWPGSLTLTGRISPASVLWRDAKFRLGLRGKEVECVTEKTVAGNWNVDEVKELTINHRPRMAGSNSAQASPGAGGPPPVAASSIHVSYEQTQNFPVVFDPQKNCLVARVSKLNRTFKTGNTDIRRYDDFRISVENKEGRQTEIPFLLDLRDVANITGLCPMLCDKDGRPTGIPVQLSKNWHYGPMGPYVMAYTSLPAKPGKTDYILRIAYGFYGTLPSASHAQLSLVGYSGHGRWDQLAIGCWGETFCFDMDMTCVDIAITDVRMLMARNGLNGEKWSWTDAGWGGDWLGVKDAAGDKLPFSGMKTAYLAHGPCMSEVRHSGFYGAGHEVSLDTRVRTVRVDDYARTFQKLEYTFKASSRIEGMWLHKMGRTSRYVTPQIAYGNRDGLIAEQEVPSSLSDLGSLRDPILYRPRMAGSKSAQTSPGAGGPPPVAIFADHVLLGGRAPWWVSFPGARSVDGRDWGTGSRALVIRSYKARFGGKDYSRPTISMPVHTVEKGGAGLNLDLLLVAPKEVTEIQPGDTVEMDLEWITLPRCADDYYGPNEAFRKHLEGNPSSWKTTFREAKGNDLDVNVTGGELLEKYPVVIKACSPEIRVRIKGGVGFVPIRFEGLAAATGYSLYELVDGREVKLDQSVTGNDFWQADSNAATGTTLLTYNLPLDNKPESLWVLRADSR